jgi:hypothetical protein
LAVGLNAYATEVASTFSYRGQVGKPFEEQHGGMLREGISRAVRGFDGNGSVSAARRAD